MKKRGRRRRRKTKSPAVEPDDVFESDFISIARFGRFVRFQSKLTEDGVKLFNANMAEGLPKAITRIDELVEKCVSLVGRASPSSLLRRAYWERAFLLITSNQESGVSDRENSIGLRKIDYVQSLIASAPSAEKEAGELSDEDWVQLGEAIESLFMEFAAFYLPCERAAAQASDPDFDEEYFSLYQQAQLHWCNVRGERYAFHEMVHLRTLLVEHDKKLKELFGFRTEDIVQNLKRILESLTHGIGNIFRDFDAFKEDFEETGNDPIDCLNLSERLCGNGLFDLESLTDLPKAFLERFAWRPGEDEEFMQGERAGWPTKIWPVFKRPFLNVDGQVLCFDVYSLFDRFYRNLQRQIFSLAPDYKRVWAEKQKEVTEALPFQFLEKLLPGGDQYQSVYYKWHVGKEDKKQWCEVDGLFAFDDFLLVIEVKAGAFTYTSPATDFDAYKASIKNLLENPAKQGMRFIDYLESEEVVGLFDESHTQIAEFSRDSFNQVVVFAVSLDPFTELAARSQSLGKLGINVDGWPVLPISLDDLRVMSDLFSNPLQFLHFIKMRVKALGSKRLELNDELDHLGMYLKCNDYTLHAEELSEKGSKQIRWIGYREPIDEYYSSLLRSDDAAQLPTQEMPARLWEVLELLTGLEKAGRRRVASALLDGSSEFRQEFCETIDTVLRRQPIEGKWIPFHFGGDMNITVVCWQTWAGPKRDREAAIRFAQVSMLAALHDEELLVELVYDKEAKLVDIDYEIIEKAVLAPELLERLEADAVGLRKRRISMTKTKQRKIGRNEKCPCGSGIKYKKCCGR